MDFPYSDIIGLRRPEHTDDAFSRVHPKMPRLNRAKLFAPYAALRGFERCIASKRVRYVPRRIPDADEAWELNRRIGLVLARCPDSRAARLCPVTVRAEYFVPCADADNEAYGRGGQYREVAGVVRRVDIPGQYLVVGNTRIDFENLGWIDAPWLRPPQPRE